MYSPMSKMEKKLKNIHQTMEEINMQIQMVNHKA